MLTFFETIITYIEIIWEWFLSFISTTVTFISSIAGVFLVTSAITTQVGGIIATSAICVVGFSVIKIILGRSNV